MSPKGRFSDPCVTQGVKKGLFRALRCAGSKKGVSFGPCVAQEAKKGSLSGPALRRKQKGVSFGPCVTQEAKKGSLSGPALRRKQKRVSFRALRCARTQNLTQKALNRPASARAAAKVERFGSPPTPGTNIRPTCTRQTSLASEDAPPQGPNAIRPYILYPANLAGVPDAPHTSAGRLSISCPAARRRMRGTRSARRAFFLATRSRQPSPSSVKRSERWLSS